MQKQNQENGVDGRVLGYDLVPVENQEGSKRKKN